MKLAFTSHIVKAASKMFSTTTLAPKQIITYYPNWAVYAQQLSPEDIKWDRITKAVYAFEKVGNTPPNLATVGSITVLPTDPSADFYYVKTPDGHESYGQDTIGKFIKAANTHGKKAILSIGGATCSVTLLDAVVQNSDGLVAAIVKFLKETIPASCRTDGKTFDGVDIDLEPYGNQWSEMSDTQIKAFVDTMSKLRSALTQSFSPEFELSIAISGNPNAAKRIKDAGGEDLVKRLDNSLSAIMVMSYDYHGSWEGVTKLNSPLYDPKDSSPTAFSTDAGIMSYVNNGFSLSKIILGAPAYGKAYKLAEVVDWSKKPSEYLDKGFTEYLGTPLYKSTAASEGNGEVHGQLAHSVKTLVDQGKLKEEVITNAGTVFAVSEDGYALSYDNPETIAIKARYVKDHELGGMMFWSASGDVDGDLVGAAHDVFNDHS
jgi:chitinase